ncbi:hypothetical protein OXX80_005593 [Metschnikowia pulcherrima]
MPSHHGNSVMFMKFDSKSAPDRQSSGNTSAQNITNRSFSSHITPNHSDAHAAAREIPASMRSILNDTSSAKVFHENVQNETLPANINKLQSEIPLLALRDQSSASAFSRSRPVGRSNAKSKAGCLTCKYRKKKCDETKPVCRDCLRFNKECVWVDHRTMNGAEIERLKAQVREKESSRKIRKRARIPRNKHENGSKPGFSPSMSPDMPLDPDGMSLGRDIQPQISGHGIQASSESAMSPKNLVVSPLISETRRSSLKTPSVKSESFQKAYLRSLEAVKSPSQNDSPEKLHRDSVQNGNQLSENNNTGSLWSSKSMNDLKSDARGPVFQDILSPFEHHAEPRSPGAVMNFLKELSSFNWSPDSGHARIEEVAEETGPLDTGSPKSSTNCQGRLSPSFNIPSFIEQMQNMSHEFPPHLENLASSFHATFSPSPRAPLSFTPELDQAGFHLYNYYSEVLSQKVSIAPNSQNDSNSYQRVFLPLAQKDKGVLYGILAWAGFHLGGQWMAEGSKYAELALKHLCEDISFNGEGQTIEDRRVIINKLATILIMCGAEICRGDVKFWSVYLQWGWKLLRSNGGILNFNNNKEEHWLISNFAYHDLLASSTSNRGTYFPNEVYDRIFLDPDGISTGNLNPLLGVSKPLYKVIGDISSLFFESKQIMNEYYNRPSNSANSSKVADFSVVSPEENGSVKSYASVQSDISDHTKVADMLNFISSKAHELEAELNCVKPDSDDLETLSDAELEWQLTTFEAFQLSCKLYLRQAIFKLNPSALECQILNNDLIKCLDILIDTPMQATLVFPTFIAGLFTVTERGKEAMRHRFEKLIADYGPWNVVRVRSLVEKIWVQNPNGDCVVDWNAMLNDLDWDLNFA